jgi:hypothetical protein
MKRKQINKVKKKARLEKEYTKEERMLNEGSL